MEIKYTLSETKRMFYLYRVRPCVLLWSERVLKLIVSANRPSYAALSHDKKETSVYINGLSLFY